MTENQATREMTADELVASYDARFEELERLRAYPRLAVERARKGDLERLEAAYTLLISATPSLYRSWIQSPNDIAATLHERLHDGVVDWCRSYQAATGRGDQGLARIGGEPEPVAVPVAVEGADDDRPAEHDANVESAE